MTNPMWTMIAAERRALAADLAALTPEQWDQPSLCEGWTVKQTLAHMTATASMKPLQFVGKFIASGFSMTAMQAKDIARFAAGDGPSTLAAFRAVETSTDAPPGPATSWLGEAIVHAEDIRRPLGIRHVYPPSALIEVADFYKKSDMLIGTKSRIAGLHLVATDQEWQHGAGPLVQGPMLSLVMAMTGRKVALADLTGDGVPQLASR